MSRDDEIAQKLREEVRAQMLALGEIGPSAEPFALTANLPEAVLELPLTEREKRVRRGAESVMLDDPEAPGGRRGFVRAVLRVPLGHPEGQVYGVFVEVDRDAYVELQRAFREAKAVRVWGKLATRLPLLDEAYGAPVLIEEDGSELRARIVDAEAEVIVRGPRVGG
jgi:hypothetical protein